MHYKYQFFTDVPNFTVSLFEFKVYSVPEVGQNDLILFPLNIRFYT